MPSYCVGEYGGGKALVLVQVDKRLSKHAEDVHKVTLWVEFKKDVNGLRRSGMINKHYSTFDSKLFWYWIKRSDLWLELKRLEGKGVVIRKGALSMLIANFV